MDLWSIVKKVGTGIISETVPGGKFIIDTVNDFLPSDKQLPANSTGDDVNNMIDSLPHAEKVTIMLKQFDVDETQIKESHNTARAMLDAESRSTHTTRPYIAKHSFHVVAVITVVIASMWAYGVGSSNPTLVTSVTDGWPFVAALVGPFVTLILGYFGILKTEHKNRLDAANGSNNPSGIAGIIKAITR